MTTNDHKDRILEHVNRVHTAARRHAEANWDLHDALADAINDGMSWEEAADTVGYPQGWLANVLERRLQRKDGQADPDQVTMDDLSEPAKVAYCPRCG